MLLQLYYINVREGQRSNQEWTIQKTRSTFGTTQTTKTNKNTTQKANKIRNTDPTKKSRVNPGTHKGKLSPIAKSRNKIKIIVLY